MPTGPLSEYLSAVRTRLPTDVGSVVASGFDNDPETVGQWLRAASDAARRGDFVLPDDDEPETLYLWMNEFPSDTDAWTLTPFAMGPGRAARSEFDWRDALIGDEIGSGLRVPELPLTGMETAQAWFAQGGHQDSELAAVQDVVLFSAFDLVERGLPYAGELPFRLTMSYSEDWRVCVWDPATDSGVVHIWESAATNERSSG